MKKRFVSLALAFMLAAGLLPMAAPGAAAADEPGIVTSPPAWDFESDKIEEALNQLLAMFTDGVQLENGVAVTRPSFSLKVSVHETLPPIDESIVNIIATGTADTYTSDAKIKVGSKTIKNARYAPGRNDIIGAFEAIFKGLGGKVKRDKKAGGVYYELNGIKQIYPLSEDPARKEVSIDTLIDMFELPIYNYTWDVTSKHNNKTGYSTYDVKVKIVDKNLTKTNKVKFTASLKEFYLGFGGAIVDNLNNGFLAWAVKAITGLKVEKAPKPASLKDPAAYYLGRVVGDTVLIALALGETIAGIGTIIASITGGAATAILSGGTLAVAGVSISAAGVTLGGAMVADGSMLMGSAIYAMSVDMSNYNYYSGGGGAPKKVSFDNKQLGDKWGEHMKDYPSLRTHNDYKKLANDIFKKPERVLFDPKYNEFYFLKGDNLLRLHPDGAFISLYPGAKSSRVLDAIESALN